MFWSRVSCMCLLALAALMVPAWAWAQHHEEYDFLVVHEGFSPEQFQQINPVPLLEARIREKSAATELPLVRRRAVPIQVKTLREFCPDGRRGACLSIAAGELNGAQPLIAVFLKAEPPSPGTEERYLADFYVVQKVGTTPTPKRVSFVTGEFSPPSQFYALYLEYAAHVFISQYRSNTPMAAFPPAVTFLREGTAKGEDQGYVGVTASNALARDIPFSSDGIIVDTTSPVGLYQYTTAACKSVRRNFNAATFVVLKVAPLYQGNTCSSPSAVPAAQVAAGDPEGVPGGRLVQVSEDRSANADHVTGPDVDWSGTVLPVTGIVVATGGLVAFGAGWANLSSGGDLVEKSGNPSYDYPVAVAYYDTGVELQNSGQVLLWTGVTMVVVGGACALWCDDLFGD